MDRYFLNGIYLLVVMNLVHSAPTVTRHNEDITAGQRPAKKVRLLEPRCKPTVSEIFLDSGSSTRHNEFIELHLNCETKGGAQPKNLLSGVKLLVLNLQPLCVVTYVDFDKLSLALNPNRKFLVLGSSTTSHVDVSLDSPSIQNVMAGISESHKLLPNGKQGFAVVIIQDYSKKFVEDFGLGRDIMGRIQPRVIGQYHRSKLIGKILDLVIWADQENSYLQSLLPDAPGQSILLPSSRQSYSFPTLSHSYCGTQGLRFRSESFILALPTPGQTNDCSSKASEECVTEVAPVTSNTQKPSIRFSGADFSRYADRQTDTEKINACNRYLPVREGLLSNPNFKWVDLDASDSRCLFSCFVCKMFLSLGFRPDLKHRPDMISNKGYFSKDIYHNSKAIKSHAEYEMHEMASKFSDKILACKGDNEYKKVILEFEEVEREMYNSTMNVIVMVYVEAKQGLSFKTHESLMEALQIIGANVGTHHHSNVATHEIVKVISSSFHKELLEYLTVGRVYFSLLCDSSTNHNEAFMICYIQTTEDGLPMSHMYSLIHLSSGEKGIAMSNSVIQKVRSDDALVPGFEEYFRNYIVAIITDGANSMTGDINSFKVHMLNYLNKKLPNVICWAHRLDTSIKFSFRIKSDKDPKKIPEREKKRTAYFGHFEDFLNRFFRFYVSRGHKKWLHFREVAEELDIVPKKFKKFIKIRWTKSHYMAMSAIDENFVPLIVDTDRITKGDGGFDKAAQQIAFNLHEKLTDKTFAVTVKEFLDFFSIYSKASIKFQESSSVVVGKVEELYTVIQNIRALKSSVGNNVKTFLSKCSCPNVCAQGTCTLALYDQCNEVHYEKIYLKRTDPEAVNLSEEREYLYTNLEAGIKEYFKFDVFSAFEIFDPNWIKFDYNHRSNEEHIPTEFKDLYIYNDRAADLGFGSTLDTKIKAVCKFYFFNDIDCMNFGKEWKVLVDAVSKSTFLLDHRTSSPVEFWKMALLQEIPWTHLTKRVVLMVSVTTFTNAECERGFSFVNNIKTKERSSMAKDTLDALVRIKANGPPVSEFNSYKLTRDFFFAGFTRVDDMTFKGGRPPSEDNFRNALKHSRIYSIDN